MAFKTYSPSKAQQMRAIAAKIQESGKRPAPKDLICEMAKKGITISSGHASTVLRAFTGKRFRKANRRVAAKAATNGRATDGHAHGKHAGPSWLVDAAKFVKDCGGFKQARGHLDVLEGLMTIVKAQ